MVTIDGFPIDVTISEEHTYESEATSYPVETGTDITDHIRPRPIVVTLEGIVSDTPLTKAAVARVANGDFVAGLLPLDDASDTTAFGEATSGLLPSDDALLRLIAIRDARQPVSIETSLQIFDNMAMIGLSIPRASDNGDALRFSATFQQIRFVTNERTTIRVAVPRAKGKDRFRYSPKTFTDTRGRAIFQDFKEGESVLQDGNPFMPAFKKDKPWYYADGTRVPPDKIKKAARDPNALGAPTSRDPKPWYGDQVNYGL